MARDRQRAKQRKQRREPNPPRPRDGDDALTPEPDALHRENVPGAWEHGGEVDEFEAALVAGADGQAEDDPGAVDRASLGEDEPADGPAPVAPAADREEATAGSDEAATAMGRPGAGGQAIEGRGGSRFLNFLRACWAELQRVQWPDRRQVGQATMVVLGFVIIAGAFLGLADFVANKLVDLII